MAYSIPQKPNQLAAANSPMVFILKENSSTIYNAAKFRYIAQVYISTTDTSAWTQVSKIKLYKNKENVGIVDVSKIVATYLETQEKNIGNAEIIDGSIHSIGISETTNLYSWSGVSKEINNLILVKIAGGYEKATSSLTPPEETLAEAETTIYAIPASTVYTDSGGYGGLDIDGTNIPLLNYIPGASTRRFLTNAPTVQFVNGSSTAGDNIDELTVAFINRGLMTDPYSVDKIALKYYNSSGVQIGSTQEFTNNTTNGGKGTADDAKNSLLYFGCGTANLENSTITPDGGSSGDAKPSNFANWAYYTIQALSSSDSGRTKLYYFYRYGSGASVDDRHQSCTRYDNVRLAWVNRLGSWDYMNFRGKSKESIAITRSESASVPGTWDDSTFDYENWDRGRKTLYTEATRKLTINSDWLNDDEASWLEELFTSTNVQILGRSNVVYPVIVTNKTYTKKTSVNNKIKIQYTINLEYANKVRTNS